ncbi:DUF6988 family protein [Planctobacterium marinum]|uniref:DUF6988 family protein n=1 Tax=Planctobacterium marinum TaxID=1631968 RepID=UPI001E39A510|nr:hypothetical protein [Planctobacterium marinum]MCC2606927.1 hypothetical protein [Planctobacterium marinum]
MTAPYLVELQEKIRELDLLQRDKSFKTPNRQSRIFLALAYRVNEICWSSANLIQQGRIAVGVSLMRIYWDYFVRALWFQHCATDEETEHFIQTDKIQRTSKNGNIYYVDHHTMCQEVDRIKPVPFELERVKRARYEVFNSFAHGGTDLLYRTMSDDNTITDQFTDEEIKYCAEFAFVVALMMAFAVADFAEHEEEMAQIGEMLQSFLPPE